LYWRFFYSYVLIPLIWLLFQGKGLFNEKVRRGIRSRRGLFTALEHSSKKVPPGKRVWFHSSSMGEFEQAKPIIAELKRRYPELRVIVTFFSPSGFEHGRKYPLADLVSYLPFDSRANARRFVRIVRPDVAVLVRYDVWPNHIWELQRQRIPVLIANATMRRRTPRRLPGVRSFHRAVYNAIDEILTVSETDAETFGLFSLTHPRIQPIGDTRFDQVTARSQEARKRHLIPDHILDGRKVLVAGSCWPEDEAELIPALVRLNETMQNVLLVHVPHEPTPNHLEELESDLSGKASFIRFSALNEYAGEQIIIVDSIGILLTLYAYAHVTFVGGSFRQRIHNVLEAAVFGIPVVFGPRHQNAQEPLMIVERGGAFVVNNSQELYRTLHNLLQDETARASAGRRAAQFVQMHTGATERFISHLASYLKLQSSSPRALPVEVSP